MNVYRNYKQKCTKRDYLLQNCHSSGRLAGVGASGIVFRVDWPGITSVRLVFGRTGEPSCDFDRERERVTTRVGDGRGSGLVETLIGPELEATLAELDETLAELDATLAELGATLAELDATLAELEATLAELSAVVAELPAIVAELPAPVVELPGRMDELREVAFELFGVAKLKVANEAPDNDDIDESEVP